LARKITLEDAVNVFKDMGYELLEDKYIKAKTKMRYRCPIHPDKELYATYDKMRQGTGCPYCAGNVRFTIEEVRDKFDSHGFILLEDNYKNSKQKLKCECKKHRGIIQYKKAIDFTEKRNTGCALCWEERKGQALRKDVDELRSLVEERGYKFIGMDYDDYRTHIIFHCEKHNKTTRMVLSNFTSYQQKCSSCADELMRGEGHPNWNGGKSQLRDYLRKLLAKWKADVLEQSNYTCFVSGVRGGSLEVHHVRNFSSICEDVLDELGLEWHESIGEYSTQELSDISNLLLSKHTVDIGIPMTKEHHFMFHNTYGKTNNNMDQVLEFKKSLQEQLVVI
jgi:hypothetical protein